MDWQEHIIDRLNLKEKSKKIIIDKIGLLDDQRFTYYLTRTGISFCIAKDVTQIITNIQNHDTVISSELEIPAYLSTRIQILEFYLEFQYLPPSERSLRLFPDVVL